MKERRQMLPLGRLEAWFSGPDSARKKEFYTAGPARRSHRVSGKSGYIEKRRHSGDSRGIPGAYAKIEGSFCSTICRCFELVVYFFDAA